MTVAAAVRATPRTTAPAHAVADKVAIRTPVPRALIGPVELRMLAAFGFEVAMSREEGLYYQGSLRTGDIDEPLPVEPVLADVRAYARGGAGHGTAPALFTAMSRGYGGQGERPAWFEPFIDRDRTDAATTNVSFADVLRLILDKPANRHADGLSFIDVAHTRMAPVAATALDTRYTRVTPVAIASVHPAQNGRGGSGWTTVDDLLAAQDASCRIDITPDEWSCLRSVVNAAAGLDADAARRITDAADRATVLAGGGYRVVLTSDDLMRAEAAIDPAFRDDAARTPDFERTPRGHAMVGLLDRMEGVDRAPVADEDDTDAMRPF